MEWLFTTKNGKVTLVVLCLAIPVLFLSIFRNFFSIIIVSVGLTMLMVPIVDHFETKGLKRNVAVILTYIVIILVVGGIVGVSYPIAIKQLNTMTRAFGVDRPDEGDSVYVQLNSHQKFEGILVEEDSIVSLSYFGTNDLFEFPASSVQLVIKIGDTVVVRTVEGKNTNGILFSKCFTRNLPGSNSSECLKQL